MIIENKENKTTIPFSDITINNIFYCDGNYYLKTQPELYSNAVCVYNKSFPIDYNGKLIYFSASKMVTPITLKLILNYMEENK